MKRRLVEAPDAQRKIDRGHRARVILENELFREVVNDYEGRIIQGWKDAKDVKEREALHARLIALAEVIKGLRELFDAGEIERQLASKSSQTKGD